MIPCLEERFLFFSPLQQAWVVAEELNERAKFFARRLEQEEEEEEEEKEEEVVKVLNEGKGRVKTKEEREKEKEKQKEKEDKKTLLYEYKQNGNWKGHFSAPWESWEDGHELSSKATFVPEQRQWYEAQEEQEEDPELETQRYEKKGHDQVFSICYLFRFFSFFLFSFFFLRSNILLPQYLEMETLFSDTLKWADSNHECLLFSNVNNSVYFLSLYPKEVREKLHPSLVSFFRKHKVGFEASGRMVLENSHRILGAITDVSIFFLCSFLIVLSTGKIPDTILSPSRKFAQKRLLVNLWEVLIASQSIIY